MTEISVAFPTTLNSWIEQQISYGRFVDASDYLRDLVRRDQAQTWRLRNLIQEGLDSGVVDEEPEAVIERIIAEARAGHG